MNATNPTETQASEIVKLLEFAYGQLRSLTPDLPRVFFKLDHGRTLGGQVWGHYAPAAWMVDGEPVAEIMIASECLAAGAWQTLQTITHEAVHALAEARGIVDTSRQGRYHNKRFVKLAEELGMTYDDPRNRDVTGRLVPDVRIGWSSVVLRPDAAVRFMGVLDLLQKEITAWRGGGKFTAAGRKDVVHAYAIFSSDGVLDVHQMGTSKYAKLAQYLSDHVTIVSSVRQGELEGWLEDGLDLVVGRSSERSQSGWFGDLSNFYPELADRGLALALRSF